MPKIERKYLAHFLDAKFGVKTQGEETYTPNYTRLGKDLEEYNEELNPDVEVNKNILGEQNVVHNGYEVQSEVDPFYAYSGDPLFERLAKIANERLTGDDCMTTKVDVLLNSDGTVAWAYREDVGRSLNLSAVTPPACRFPLPCTTRATASRAPSTSPRRPSPQTPTLRANHPPRRPVY